MRLGVRILGGVVFVALLAAIGWQISQVDGLNKQLQQARAEQTQVAATLQANRAELNAAQTQANTLATRATELQAQLQTVRATQVTTRTENLSFVSDLDGTTQRYLLITPENLAVPRVPLVVYLHGMGNGAEEILKWRANQESLVAYLMRREVVVASPAYRGDSWLNPAATADVTQMIRLLKNRFSISAIIVAGYSMGGTAAVMYPLVAPPDIAVNGIVAAAFASDVIDLFSETKNAQVKESLRVAYGGAPIEQSKVYEERALLRNIIRFSAKIPVALYASYSDSMIPPTQQTRLRDALAARGNPLLFAQIPGDHQVDSLDEGFAFVLNRVSAK